MHNILPLDWLLRTDFSAGLAKGFHSGGLMHRAAGAAFGGKLLMFGLGAIVVLTLAAMATLSASDWAKKRYKKPDYTRAAAVGAFTIVVLVLGFVLSRLV